ncbi:MAG: DUF5591 domain-containing protein [Candidatus Bathyarchaeia archaeon]
MTVKTGATWNGTDLVWSGDGKTYLRGVGAEYLLHPFFEEGYRRVIQGYKLGRHYKLGLFIPCAYGKPYSQSYIHYFIIKALKRLGKAYADIHQIVVSNAGVIPRELEEHYPYCCYDWNPRYENPEIKELYTETLSRRLRQYVERFNLFYDRFACYLRWDSESYRAIRMLEEDMKLKVKIPNLSLRPEKIPKSEVKQASFGVYDYEDDIVLITPSNLRSLQSSIRGLLR